MHCVPAQLSENHPVDHHRLSQEEKSELTSRGRITVDPEVRLVRAVDALIELGIRK